MGRARKIYGSVRAFPLPAATEWRRSCHGELVSRARDAVSRTPAGASTRCVACATYDESELGALTFASLYTPTPRRLTSSPPNQPVTNASNRASTPSRKADVVGLPAS